MEIKIFPKPPVKRFKWLLISLVQLAVFGILIYFLYKNFNFPSFVQAIRRSDKAILTAAVFLFLLREIIYGMRWWNSVRLFNQYLNITFFAKSAFIIKFYDYILPLPAADDFYKVALLKMKKISFSKAIASTVFDKVFGFIIITALFFFSLPILFRQTVLTGLQLYLVVIALALTIIPMILLVFRPRFILYGIDRIGKKIFSGRYPEADNEIQKIRDMPKRAKLTMHLLFTLLFNLVLATMIYLLFLSLGYTMPFVYILVCIPLFTFSGILPLSYQGIGLYEAAMTFVFINFFKADPVIVQSVAILHLSFNLFILCIGGLLAIPQFTEYLSAFRQSIRAARR